MGRASPVSTGPGSPSAPFRLRRASTASLPATNPVAGLRRPGSEFGGSELPGTSGTQFGASVYRGSSSWQTAVEQADDRYGGLEVVRAFYPGLPSSWAHISNATDASLVVSFKAHPAQILSGENDQRLKQWFATAPQDRDIWWAYYHEPEDNVERGDFTAEQWRAAYRHIAALANEANNPRLLNTIVLMCWTLDPASGRSISDYFPGADVVETIGWDCYSEPSADQAYENPSELYGPAIATSRESGRGLGHRRDRIGQGPLLTRRVRLRADVVARSWAVPGRRGRTVRHLLRFTGRRRVPAA